MTHVLDTYPLDFSRQEVPRPAHPAHADLRLGRLGEDPAPRLRHRHGLRQHGPGHEAGLDRCPRRRAQAGPAPGPPQHRSVASRPAPRSGRSSTTCSSATPAASTEPRDSIEWKIAGAVESGLERIIESESTLLDISFLERGLELSPSVAKLVVTLNDQKRYYGTAFRIGADLLLTNHHVLFDAIGPATAVEAWFGYEVAFSGVDRAHTVLPCRTDSIVGRIDHDWAVVRTEGEMPPSAGVVALSGAPPAQAARPGLHHPASAGRGEEDRDDPQRRHGRDRRRPAVPDRHRRRLVRLSRL